MRRVGILFGALLLIATLLGQANASAITAFGDQAAIDSKLTDRASTAVYPESFDAWTQLLDAPRRLLPPDMATLFSSDGILFSLAGPGFFRSASPGAFLAGALNSCLVGFEVDGLGLPSGAVDSALIPTDTPPLYYIEPHPSTRSSQIAQTPSPSSLDERPIDLYVAPEPGTLLLWSLLGLTFAGSSWMLSYWSRWQEMEDQHRLGDLIPAMHAYELGAGI